MNYKESLFDSLQDYLQSGSSRELSVDETEYYNTLLATLGVYRKYGRANAVQFLMAPPFYCQRRHAQRLFEECISLFYVDDGIPNAAWRNLMFEEMLSAAKALLHQENITTDDIEVYSRLMEKAYKMKGLDKPDMERPRETGTQQQIVIHSIHPEQVGIPEINRNELAEIIRRLDVSAGDKERLRRDARLDDISFEDVIDDTIAKAEEAGQ